MKRGLSVFKLFKKVIQIELFELRQFIEEIAFFFETKMFEVETDYLSAINAVEEKERENIEFLYEDDFQKYGRSFPKQYYNPILLSLFSLLESWMKRICELENHDSSSHVKITDLSGNNYIEKSRKYLMLVAELDLSDADKLWSKIREIQKIRNAIIHNESNILIDKNRKLEKQDLYNLIKKDVRFEFNQSNGDFYIKNKEYLVEVIQTITDYLDIILDKIIQKIEK